MTLQVRYCPQCGTRRTGYFRFCGRCGLDFDELTLGKPEDQPTAEPKPEPTTPIWPPPVQWPPPDAAPTPEVAPPPAEMQPPVVAATPPAPRTPTASEVPGVDWPARTSTAYVQTPAQRPILARRLAPPRAGTALEPVAPAPVTSRRPAVTFTRIAIVALAALLAVNAISRAISQSASTTATPAPTVVLSSPLIVESPSPAATPAAVTPGPSFAPTTQTQFAEVTKIIDGDTIRVNIDGTEYPVRYIGIDAPEPASTDPVMKKVADSATATNAALVEGKDVYLEGDVSDRDQFDRLLRNVWLIDSGGSHVLVNLELVRLGLATVTTVEPNHRYVDFLTTAENAAKSEKRGLWASGSTPASAPSPAALATPKTLVGSGGSSCHPSYSPCLPIVADLDCADVLEMGKAPVRVTGPDEYRLDRDKDGLGCES